MQRPNIPEMMEKVRAKMQRGPIRLVPGELAQIAKPILVDRIRQLGLRRIANQRGPVSRAIGCSALAETTPHGGGGPILAHAYDSHL
jgi:hypothetical protein